MLIYFDKITQNVNSNENIVLMKQLITEAYIVMRLGDCMVSWIELRLC